MHNVILKTDKVYKTYKQNNEEYHVLENITIDILENDFTIIMGPSGAGKSTLLYALSGMDQVSSGTVEYKGKKISNLKENELAQYRRNEFGFIFQNTNLVSNLTLFENVAVAGYVCNKEINKVIDENAKKLLSKMNVKDASKRLPGQTSGGESQRAAIARALINRPGIIFADEPTGALNKNNSEEILNILSQINKEGNSIVMVTHDVNAALRGNRILYLEDGKIIDECKLPRYEEDNIEEREQKVSSFLSKLQW